MVHYSTSNGGARYGTSSSRERHHDKGGPSSDTASQESLRVLAKRHGISRLPEVTGDKEPKRKFKSYPIGYFHIDIAELRTAEGKLYLLCRDQSRLQVRLRPARRQERQNLRLGLPRRPNRRRALQNHTVLTDNGIQFTFPPRYADGPTAQYVTHMFDMRCRENGLRVSAAHRADAGRPARNVREIGPAGSGRRQRRTTFW